METYQYQKDQNKTVFWIQSGFNGIPRIVNGSLCDHVMEFAKVTTTTNEVSFFRTEEEAFEFIYQITLREDYDGEYFETKEEAQNSLLINY